MYARIRLHAHGGTLLAHPRAIGCKGEVSGKMLDDVAFLRVIRREVLGRRIGAVSEASHCQPERRHVGKYGFPWHTKKPIVAPVMKLSQGLPVALTPYGKSDAESHSTPLLVFRHAGAGVVFRGIEGDCGACRGNSRS